MPAPVVRFDPVAGSLRIDLSAQCAVSIDYPRNMPPTFSVYRAGIELAPDDVSRQEFCRLIGKALGCN